ncbi:uncharacterized protein LOC144642146 [Oculina patagonica]
MFNCTVKNKFSALELVDDDLNNHWAGLKKTWQESCDEVLGRRASDRKEWLSNETWSLTLQRKGVKEEMNGCKEQARQRDLTSRYWKLNKDVRKSARKDKKEFFNALATEAETAAGQRNMKRLYEITRAMSGKKSKQTRPVKNKEGRTISTEPEQRARWAEHSHDILNRQPPPVTPDFIETNGPLLTVSIQPPSKAEIVRAVKQLKNGKAAGPDGIPPEALKINPNNTAEMLHPLFLKIWEAEKVPTE